MPRNVALCLIAVPLVHGIGGSLLFAILPAVARDLGLSEAQVGMIYMLPAIAWSLTTSWWGARCDSWDRKPVLLLSLVGFSLSMLIFAGAAAAAYAGWLGATLLWALILGSRMLYSGMSSGALPAAQAYVIAATPLRQRTAAIGRITAAMNFGTLLGPGIIGILAVFGTLTPLLAAALFSMLVWAGVRYALPSQTPLPRPEGLPVTRLRVWDPRIRLSLYIGLCGSVAQATLLQTLGFYFIDGLGVSTADAPRIVGVALMLSALATLFSQVVLVPRLDASPRTLEYAGLLTCLIAFVGMALSASTAVAWLATSVCGLGYGLLRPGNIVHAAACVQPHEQGSMAGINGAVWSAGYILTPLLVLPLHALDPHLPFLAGCLVLSTGLLLTFRQGSDRYR